MSLAIIAPNRDVSSWLAALKRDAPLLLVEVWPEVENADAVTCTIVWNHPRGCLQSFPNLKLICSMGAGVDHILSDPDLPDGVPITRVIDQGLSFSMSNYVLTAVLYHHRMLEKFVADKKENRWDPLLPSEVDCVVGIMGFGVLGLETARKLKATGFKVLGYASRKKVVDGFECFGGEEELDDFLQRINVMVCLLPATAQTRGILSKTLFDRMNKGTYLINAARGQHQVTSDIIAAINSGQLSGAFLDVFEVEPLPKEHPAWAHPKIMITPHIASITDPYSVVPQILSDIEAIESGRILPNLVSRQKGY